MKVNLSWLQSFIEEGNLPASSAVAEALTLSSFEVESVETKGGETVFDIAILPNRSHDCLSHRGVAGEIALLFGLKRKTLMLSESFSHSKILKITLDKGCYRYSGAVLTHIAVSPSPKWLVERLESIGQKSINNIVDAANYVMFSLGQPLHAFDMDKLSSKGEVEINVSTSIKEELFTALDGKEYTLPEGALVLRDGAKKLIGIAGVKGGKAAEIDSTTRHIILEAANFDSVSVRKTSHALNLRTDASIRFENSISPELTMYAIGEVIELIKEIAGADTQIEGVVDVYPSPASPYRVGISQREVEAILGTPFSEDLLEEVLTRLSFSYKKVSPRKTIIALVKECLDAPYKYGASVLRSAPQAFDCSSLVAYVYAHAGVPVPRISIDQYVFGTAISQKELEPGDVVYSNTGITTRGIHTVSQEFLPGTQVSEGVDHCGIYVGEGKVIHATEKEGKVVEEKLSESSGFKKIVGFRRLLSNESNRFIVIVPFERLDIRIPEDLVEEIGRVYGYEKIASSLPRHSGAVLPNKHLYYLQKIRSILFTVGYSEVYTYSFQPRGDVELANPQAQDKKFLRKSLYESVTQALGFNLRYADLLGLSEIRLFEIGTVFSKKEEHLSFCVGAAPYSSTSKVLDELLSLISKNLGTDIALFGKKIGGVWEGDIGRFIDSLPEPTDSITFMSLSNGSRFAPVSAYPFVLRDIAIFVPKGTPENEVLTFIEREAGNLLVKTRLFDVFTKKMPDGDRTSFAWRLVFQSHDKTLSDDIVNQIMNRITQAINSTAGWQVR